MDWANSPTFAKLMKGKEDAHTSSEIQEYYKINQELKDEFSNNIDFKCLNPNCNNREAIFGTTYLPYCDKNMECLRKNLEYLILENCKLKK